MNKARTTVGTHAYFFPALRAFTVPSAGVCGQESKPGSTDAGWIYCGVSKWKFANKNEYDAFFGPSPGAYMQIDDVLKKKAIQFKGTLMQLHNLSYQMMLGTLQLPDSPAPGGQYNPNAGDGMVRGWMQFQQYNQFNQLFNTVEHYIGMNIPGDVDFADGPVDIDVQANGYFSTQNSGTLS